MVASEGSFPIPRLKREDCERTKHDSSFSKWQVLIGPTDWQDHALGKEGATRYRVHNLPHNSGPGVYELGIAVPRSTFGRDYAKVDPVNVVAAYLGQADNVRTRLQMYGRSGSHQGPSLFEEMFSRGCSIVFRWAPFFPHKSFLSVQQMKDKREAEKTEARLLKTFDYALNKGGNGERRPLDVLQKIDKKASSAGLPKLIKKLQFFSQGEVGIKIKARKPVKPENADDDSKSFIPGVFKFSRSRPTLVSDTFGTNEGLRTCGFIMSDGIPCNKPPASGRMRCDEHKGKRICGLTPESNRGGGSRDAHDDYVDPNHNAACGVVLGHGTFCARQPISGRKRCEAHKGMRVGSLVSKPTADNKCYQPVHGFGSAFGTSEHSHVFCGATLGNGSVCRRQPTIGNKRCWQHKGQRADSSLSWSNRSFMGTGILTCGVALQNGSVCMRAPVSGRKRCEQHKGMRAY
ncbi:hypothetical protein K2173_011731 [Erythroxylum novogranatense]|uniref:GIY-YIG homing endonuclease n=1 Tax=Erythroxylum novogranatense TaxID=1862640 RepID=A0AAV8TKZ8_9ROSI|nr:hypothetical protein K2173_011731 [Erythroxylum novogranatense]